MRTNNLVFKVIGKEVVINLETIVVVIGCPRFDICYLDGWDEIYAAIGTIKCTINSVNIKKEYVQKVMCIQKYSSTHML